MKLVVIESPYAGDVDGNVRYAKLAVLDCLARGESPYASHLFFTQDGLLDDTRADHRRLGIEAGFAWGQAAESVVFYVDRGWSKGMIEGYRVAYFRGAHIEIRSLERGNLGIAALPPELIAVDEACPPTLPGGSS